MKQHKRLPLALFLVFALCIQTLSFTSAAAALADPEPVFSASDMTFSSGTDAVALPQSAVTQLSGLSSGTIIVDFTPTAMSTANCLFSLSNSSVTDAYFNLYIDDRGFLGLEVRNHGETRYVNLQGPAEVTRNTRHIMALSADPQEGYKFYFDGDMVFQMPVALYELWEYDYRFMSTVNSADVGYMGATYRNGSFGYPYYGTIDSVRVYDTALAQDVLEAETYIEKDSGIIRQENVFSFEDWNTEGIRIPSILRTDKGTIIATGDIRFGDAAGASNDPPNNCDIGIRVSSDDGATWSQPKMLLNFLDYPNEPQVPMKTDSASYCDSLLVKGQNGRVFFFCDAMTGNVRAPYAAASTGYTSDGYLILKDSAGTQYELHEDDGTVYLNGAATDYTVGPDFTLYKNGQEAGNIFYTNYGTYDASAVPRKTELRVINTVFLIMCYSDDGGYTWSDPKLMNYGFKTSDMKHFGTAPGIGIVIQTGKYQGRILVPLYYNSNSFSGMSGAVLYSDDNGATWHLGESPNDARAAAGLSKIGMGEIQIVEMPPEGDDVSTQLKMFVRQSGGVLIATSYDGGQTWAPDMPRDPTLVAPTPYGGCQQSVINYSHPIDGKPAVIFANAAANSRSNGTIRIGLINENGTNSEGRINYTFDWKYKKVIRSGEFGYSCLMEQPNGNIVCFYEQESRPDNIHSLVFGEYTLDYIKDIKPTPDTPNLVYSSSEKVLPLSDGTYTPIGPELPSIAGLHEGTILVRFTPTSTDSIHSLIGVSNGQTGNQNSYFHLYYSNARLGFEIRRQEGGDFEKNSAPVTIEAGKEYCAAFTADPDYGYQLFLNGEMVLDLPLSELTASSGYGFMADIPGIDSGYLGMTRRQAPSGQPAAFEYPFTGTIHNVQIFDGVFSAEHMKQVTYVASSGSNVYSNSGVTITPSQPVQIDDDSVTDIAAMHSGAIVVEFTPQISSIHSLIGISNSTTANSHFHLYVGGGVLGYEIRRQNGGDFVKSSAAVDMTSGEKHIAAFTADPDTGYKLFFDGELVQVIPPAELPSTGYGFISDIPGINAGYLGKTARSGNQYPYNGSIENIKVFNTDIPDDTLTAWTLSGGF